HEVIERRAEVPDDDQQERDDDEGLQRVVHGFGLVAGGCAWVIIAARRGRGRGGGVSRRMPLWAGWGLALGVAAVCASLGSWQLKRMHAKQDLLEASARVLDERHARPLALAADPARAREYDWAAG